MRVLVLAKEDHQSAAAGLVRVARFKRAEIRPLRLEPVAGRADHAAHAGRGCRHPGRCRPHRLERQQDPAGSRGGAI